jgi:hypothetical protein
MPNSKTIYDTASYCQHKYFSSSLGFVKIKATKKLAKGGQKND